MAGIHIIQVSYYWAYLLIDIEDNPLNRLKANDDVNDDPVACVVFAILSIASSSFSTTDWPVAIISSCKIDSAVVDGSLAFDFINLSMDWLVFFSAFK